MSSDSAPDPAALGADMAHTMPVVTGGAPAPAAAASAETGAASSNPAPKPAAPSPAAAPASQEVDAKGRPFDPAKHLPKKNKAGLWMPKSPGRFGGAKRPAPSLPASPSTEPDLFQSAASSPSPSRSGSAPASSPGSPGAGSYIPPEEELPPKSDPQTDGPSASKAEPAPEPVGGADDVAAVACDLLSEGVGILTGAPEEAEPSAKEGDRLRNVLGAYLRSKGVETRGAWAVGLAFLAWLVRTAKKPKTRAWVRSKVQRGGDVIDIEPRAPAGGSVEPGAGSSSRPAPAPAAPSSAPNLPPTETGTPAYSLNLPGRR